MICAERDRVLEDGLAVLFDRDDVMQLGAADVSTTGKPTSMIASLRGPSHPPRDVAVRSRRGHEFTVGPTDRLEPRVATQPLKRRLRQLDPGRELDTLCVDVVEHGHARQVRVTISR